MLSIHTLHMYAYYIHMYVYMNLLVAHSGPGIEFGFSALQADSLPLSHQ